MGELTQRQQKILIEYYEKMQNASNLDEFKEKHELLMSIPQFAFIKEYIPPIKDDWAEFKQLINNIKHREAKDYRKKYGNKEEPAYEQVKIKEEINQNNLTPHEFIKAALNCKTPDEYEKLYIDNITNFKKVSIRPFTPQLVGLFNEGADVPITHVSNTPENLVKLYKFADKALCDVHNEIPTPGEVRENGIPYLHEIDERMERNKQEEFHRREIGDERQKEVEKTKEQEKEEELDMYKAFAANAFIAGTKVPPFVMVNENKFIDFSGYRFEKENAEDSSVMLVKKEGRKKRAVKIDSVFYKHIIENSKIIANAPAVTPEVIKKYEQSAELDHEKLRENTASNFWHNYRVMCRQNATNQSDAMKIANEIVSKMPVLEQLYFKRQVKEYNRLSGSKDSYNKRLMNYYDENVKDLPVTKSIFSKESPQLVSDNYHDIVQRTGDRIDKNSSLQIGGIVKMSFDFKDIVSGKKEKLPPKELIIVAASEEKNKVVLVDKDNLSKYTVSRDEFLKMTQKHEKVMQKEKKKELKRERKDSFDYSY